MHRFAHSFPRSPGKLRYRNLLQHLFVSFAAIIEYPDAKRWGGAQGLRGSELKQNIARVLELTGLQDRAKETVKRYSGGMKRRLNFACGWSINLKFLYILPIKHGYGSRWNIPMTLFDAIGKTYNKTRIADDRIVSEIIRLADLGRGNHIIADIGAGTGNYSVALANAGFQIRAVEPSAIMLSQLGWKTNIERIAGCAEKIPLKTGCVDAAFSVLALPHFSDIKQAFGEMARILRKGPIILFSFDPQIGK